jgi:hypothetical protein
MSLFVIPDAKLRQNSACSRNRLGLLGRADKGASATASTIHAAF